MERAETLHGTPDGVATNGPAATHEDTNQPFSSEHCVDVGSSTKKRDYKGSYQPIENYGIIGNMKTCCLVGINGSIDFMCYPYLNSPSLFCSLLDSNVGGHWSLCPDIDPSHLAFKQYYWPETNILVTRFITSNDGIGQVIDYMPVGSLPPQYESLVKHNNDGLRKGQCTKKARLDFNCTVRMVTTLRGTLRWKMECRPAFNYARDEHQLTFTSWGARFDRIPSCSASCASKTVPVSGGNEGGDEEQDICADPLELSVGLLTHTPLTEGSKRSAIAHFVLEEDQKASFILTGLKSVCRDGNHDVKDEVIGKEEEEEAMQNRVDGSGEHNGSTKNGEETICRDEVLDFLKQLTCKDLMAMFHSSVDYWQNWLKKCTYTGRWREVVHRSALTMKLMTFEPTGAIVAAPTFGLPEDVGGVRNWDYRYTWVRDAAFTLYGFLRIGFSDEANAFMQWLMARCEKATERGKEGTLQVLYDIFGEKEVTEITLDHLEGYQGSQPVRVGNAAYNQLQLDIYGELMDSIYIYNKFVPISYDMWLNVRKMVDWVCDNWQQPDVGIWEVRSENQHFVYSKVMVWVALDRGVRLADRRSLPAPNRGKWLQARDCIYEEVMNKGYNKEIGSFVQYYGSTSLDASNLIFPLVFFISPSDPRMINTINAINRKPEDGGLVNNSLVYRYNLSETEDGLEGEEGTFNMCTFWLIEAITRVGSNQRNSALLREARLKFEEMLTYANHLGLYAEETGFNGMALGNFPQAFTHLSLISSAFNLNRAFDGHIFAG
ncbi:Glucoamylase [Balamuthia mandrillaris]